MYQLNFDCHKTLDLAVSESKVITLPLQQKALDCAGDRTLEMLETSALSVSASVGENTEPSSVQEAALAEQHVIAVDKLHQDCTVDGQENLSKRSSEQQLEQSISNLLKYGVLLASALVLVGGVIYLIRYGAEPANYQFFQGESSVFSTPRGVMTAVLSGHSSGIIQLGLLVLIATPILRVAFSLLTFLVQRDLVYILLTAFVLSGLICSLIAAYA